MLNYSICKITYKKNPARSQTSKHKTFTPFVQVDQVVQFGHLALLFLDLLVNLKFQAFH